MRGGRPWVHSSLLEAGANPHSIEKKQQPRTLGLIDLALNSSSVCVTLGNFVHLPLTSPGLFTHL